MSFELSQQKQNYERPRNRLRSEKEIREIETDLENRSREYATKNPEMAIWMYDHLNAIDVVNLQKSFEKVIAQVHGTFDPERIVPRERTYITGDGGIAGLHYAGAGISEISGSVFVKMTEKLSPSWKMATLLDLVCHENAHATGKISTEYHLEIGAVILDVGYRKRIESSSGKIAITSLFNEGVTELVAQRVAREYVMRRPMRLEDGSVLDIDVYESFLNEHHLERGTSRNYDAAREFVQSLSMHIANALSVSTEFIEDALVAGYFRGTEDYFKDPDFLDSVMGPGFSEELRFAKSAADLQRIIHEYRMPAVTPVIAARIDRALKQLAKIR